MVKYDLDTRGMKYAAPVYSNDFPGGERRLVQKQGGPLRTLANGRETFEDGTCTNALPGKLLRSTDVAA